MSFIPNFLFLTFPLLVTSAFIPQHIWNDVANYDTCFRRFARRHAWDPSKENNDVPVRSDASHLKSALYMQTWPNGRVPYLLSNRIESTEDLKRLACGMQLFHTKTCVHFVPATGNDQKYLSIDKKMGEGCSSTVVGKAYSWEAQIVNLDWKCWDHATIIHELMHAIGFFHEQNRDDRDQYVKIHWNNIGGDWVFQYWTSTQQGYISRLVGKYDYNSVMHYGRGPPYSPSMTALKGPVYDNNNKMGNRYGPSEWDVWKINDLYSCSAAKPKPTRHTTRRPIRTTLPPEVCHDRDTSNCYKWKSYCNTNNQYMIDNCRRTCGRCAPASVCYDISPNCPINLVHCYRSEFVDKRCQKSCAHCGCRDVDYDCHRKRHQCSRNTYVDQRCKKSCGHC